ncbi:MAG: phosphatidate cytidylyltransferase, partial [Acidimicrobiia bacterium]
MARSDDPGAFDPHPGDPWHPGWQPPAASDPEAGEEADDETASSVEQVYGPLSRLGETEDDDEIGDPPPLPPPPSGATATLQTPSSAPSATDRAELQWSTRNIEEERRLEAAAATFAAAELRETARDLAQETADVEAERERTEAMRRGEQVEVAETVWVHDELTSLEQTLASDEAGELDERLDSEAARRSEQVESALGVEAAEDAAGAAISLGQFETFRESVESDAEAERRRSAVEGTEASLVHDRLERIEHDLAGYDADTESENLTAEEGRRVEQIEFAGGTEAAEAAHETEAAVADFEDYRGVVERDAEVSRMREEVAGAEEDDFDGLMRAAVSELVAEAAAADAGESAAEMSKAHSGGELVRSEDASADLELFASELMDAEGVETLGAAAAEAALSETGVEAAEADDFAISLEATQLDLTEAEADAAAEAAADEAGRFEEQREQAVAIEREERLEQVAARFSHEEESLRFAAEVDERFALDAELQRALDATTPAPDAAAVGVAVAVPGAGVQRFGWLRRLFRVGTTPVAEEVLLPQLGPAEIANSELETLEVAESQDGGSDGPVGERSEDEFVEQDDEDVTPPGEGLFDVSESSDADPDMDYAADVVLAIDSDADPDTGFEAAVDLAIDAEIDPDTDADIASDAVTVAAEPDADEAAPGQWFTVLTEEDDDAAAAEPEEELDASDAAVEAHREDHATVIPIIVAPDAEDADGADGAESPPTWSGAPSGDDDASEDIAGVAAEGEDEERPDDASDIALVDDEADQVEDEGSEFASAWAASELDDDIPDFAAFTSEEYVLSSTEEYAGLADAVAKAAEEDSGELAAVSAPIPGLETGVVGFDDVVDQAVDDAGPLPARRSNLALRVITGLGLLALFGFSLLSPVATGLLVLAVMLVAASEFYTVLIRSGYRPIALFGFLGILGAQLGTWAWGAGSVVVAGILTLVATALLVGVSPAQRHNMENLSLTIGVMLWIGGLGAFAFAMVDAAEFRWLLGSVVVTTAFMDVAQFFVGRRIGKHPLAPWVSPKKSIEGLVAGLIAALGAGIGFGFFGPFDLASGLALGAVVAAAAPWG